MQFFVNILAKIQEAIIQNVFNWIITALITYMAVKSGTRQYYDIAKRQVAKKILERGTRKILGVKDNDGLSLDILTVLVEYKGRSYHLKKKNKCGFFEKTRKTVCSVGMNASHVSSIRPMNYGVLGVANALKRPVIFNFKTGDLVEYYTDKIKLNVINDHDGYKWKDDDGDETTYFISKHNAPRNIMIAIPLIKESDGRLVGGLTFDMKIENQTESENQETKDYDVKNSMMNSALLVADEIKNAYFRKKGEELI